MGPAHGTVATGGLPPLVESVEAPPYDTALVRARHPESDDLPPSVALFGSWHGDDWEVELTLKEARILLDGLQAAILTAESA